jgi:trans-2,3-dihydro-3-hydroxyanthranilate isomerase
VAFAIVPVKSCQALSELRLDWKTVNGYLQGSSDAQFFYFVTRETKDPAARLHARMIFYNGEDPATGSAAGCCAAWAVQNGVLAPGAQGLIEQGIETRRPSYLYIRADKQADVITNVRVGGYVVKIIDGKVTM